MFLSDIEIGGLPGRSCDNLLTSLKPVALHARPIHESSELLELWHRTQGTACFSGSSRKTLRVIILPMSRAGTSTRCQDALFVSEAGVGDKRSRADIRATRRRFLTS